MGKKKSETQNVEFKESWADTCLKTICAFANTKGGYLYIGLDDDGNPIGLKDARRLLEELPNKIKELVGVIPSIECKKKKGRDCIVITVQRYDSPVSYQSRTYVRSGSGTHELKGPELTAFFLSKSNKSWESLPAETATFDDIDKTAIDTFTAKSSKILPNTSNTQSTESLLSHLNLVSGNKITHAAILLFGKDPQRFHPNSFIKIGKFSKENEPLTSDEIKGNLFVQAESVLEILQKKYLTAEIKIEGLYRSDNLEYPVRALREAIVNSIVHKDYSGTHTQIRIYPDRLVFWNPGQLHRSLTIESLKQDHQSHPRNPLIAEKFFFAGLIERWGSGTVNMTKECIDANLPEPIFQESEDGLRVTFSKNVWATLQLKKIGLNDRQIAGVNHVVEFGQINNQTYQGIARIDKRTATRDLAELVLKGVVIKRGVTGKGTYYELAPQVGKSNFREKKSKDALDELDLKLEMLDKELEGFDPNEEIKLQFSEEVFWKLFDQWIDPLTEAVLPVIQKFNKYFVNPKHWVNLPQPLGGLSFVNDNPTEFVKSLREKGMPNGGSGRVQPHEAAFRIMTNYGSFRRAGLNTFGCNYAIEIKFSENWYEVCVDDEVMQRNQKVKVKLQYHKPLPKAEIETISRDFGNLIFKHITEAVARLKDKKGNGS